MIFSSHSKSLESAQWISIAIGSVVILIALVFYFIPMPEIDDEDLAAQTAEIKDHVTTEARPLRRQYLL